VFRVGLKQDFGMKANTGSAMKAEQFQAEPGIAFGVAGM
jgi:hypothetical protein